MALGSALAFGLGGRAADLINSGYRKAQQQSDQVPADLQAGQQRAQGEAQQYTQQYAQPGAQPGPRYEDGAAQRPGATEAYRTR